MERIAPTPGPDKRVTIVLGQQLPGDMTPRARAYMTIAAVRHLLLGAALILMPQAFQSETYNGIKDLLPLPPESALAGWGGIFLATGIFCSVAAALGRQGEARWALLASVLTTALWAGGFTVYVGVLWAQTGELVNPSGPIIWAAVCLKDITMLRNPLINPFEQLVRAAGTDNGAEADRR